MIDLEIKNDRDCMGCYGCYNICPVQCITMESNNEGFWYPKVDYDKCIKCKKCINVCPIINKAVPDNEPLAYACYNKNENIRLDSSSGGVFTLVANEILKNNGVVFGVQLNQDFNAIHSYTESKEGLEKYRGSKYLQSRVGDTYKEVKGFLDKDRDVLFTGTPCQISGLKSYLGKPYPNLFCMDNICHGVPSPKVWGKYVDFREKKSGSTTQRIAFRLKNEGWKLYSVLFVFTNNTEYRENQKKDLFMRAFLKDICLRPSCYDCEFKSIHRKSDITMADFWGIQNIAPELDDDRGTSLIFVNSDSGENMFDRIKNNMIFKDVNINEAISYNPAAIKSVSCHPKRNEFFNELDILEFDTLVNKYCKDKFTVKIKRLCISTLQKTGTLELAKSILKRK